jgi:hypothetical protein
VGRQSPRGLPLLLRAGLHVVLVQPLERPRRLRHQRRAQIYWNRGGKRRAFVLLAGFSCWLFCAWGCYPLSWLIRSPPRSWL